MDALSLTDDSALSPLARKAIAAYGGRERWCAHPIIEAQVSVRGLAFTLKRRPFFEQASIRMNWQRPYSRIMPIGSRADIAGVLEGDTTRLEDIQGNILAERLHPRTYFPYGRRLFKWDDLDMAYFANYAFWNYFSLPVLLMHKDVLWQEAGPGILNARFPEGFPTHSAMQQFRFDTQSGLLRQHNYVAEVISGLASAAHVVHQHTLMDGLNVPTLRRVSPQTTRGRALGWPVLIEIQVHSFRLCKN